MERLTKPDSDYCHDICGSVNGCPRLTGNKKRCRGYDLYERLKWYENVWPALKDVTVDCKILALDEAREVFERLTEEVDKEVLKGNE